MVLTGLRMGEAAGLCWDAIEFVSDSQAKLRVIRTLSWDYKTKGPYFQDEAKTATSIRTVAIEGFLLDVFRDIAKEVAPDNTGPIPIFRTNRDRLLRDNTMLKSSLSIQVELVAVLQDLSDWGKGNSNMWKTYRANAKENLESARLLSREGLFTTSYECFFFAIEIAMKAWIVRKEAPRLDHARRPDYKGDPFFSHDLWVILRNWPDLKERLREGCPAEYNLLSQTLRYKRQWKPWKRYQARVSEKVVRQELNLAEGLQEWMLRHLLKS